MGIGCYMFTLDDEFVIDATIRGNSARFLNHSCDPNAYSKHMTIDGKKKIIFLALREIERGEEITYNSPRRCRCRGSCSTHSDCRPNQQRSRWGYCRRMPCARAVTTNGTGSTTSFRLTREESSATVAPKAARAT